MPTYPATFLRASVVAAARDPRLAVGVGAHGWRGRWLVNTSARDLVPLTLEPAACARALGVPVRVRALTVSPADAAGLVTELAR